MRRIYISLIVSTVIGLTAIGAALLSPSHGKADASCSSSNNTVHQVTIKSNKLSPVTTEGKLCDTIRITNYDNVTREIAFGPHEDHVAYDGIAERALGKNQSFTITLNKAGTYHYHDHLHDEVDGYFLVTPQ